MHSNVHNRGKMRQNDNYECSYCGIGYDGKSVVDMNGKCEECGSFILLCEGEGGDMDDCLMVIDLGWCRWDCRFGGVVEC